MKKIPVWQTIRFAYQFALGEIGTIIGLIWAPTVLIAVLQFLPYALGTEVPGDDPAKTGAAGLANLAFFSLTLVLYAMNAVAVTRQALGVRKGGAAFHFSIGRAEWRVLGANLLCAVALGALVLTYSSGFLLISPLAKDAANPAILGLIAYSVAGIGLLLFVGVRLAFLVIPVAVVEERIDLARAWRLTAGSFWRLFVVVLAVSLPLLAIQFGATIAIAGAKLIAPLPDKQEAIAAALNARMALLDKHMPELISLSLFLAPFNFGLTLGAEAAAYRVLAQSQSGGSSD